MVGVTLPLTTVLQQVSITTSGPPLFPHIITHIRGKLTLKQQRETGKIMLGGGWRGDGDPSSGVKRARRDSLIGNLKFAAETIPKMAQASLLRTWVGFEGRTPDKLLISGPLGPSGLHVLGCSAGGFTISPMAGQLAADYVIHGKPEVDEPLFNVQRFLTPSVQAEAN